ncbi:MSHA biogenesis protein MshK [Enterovibrio baiacu]|uniref:MSHA biogenesis protein MshK n=1 Tax=Enterovibrio baiacu TaxID=2491023 RepID=UPI003D12FB67
MKITAKCVMGLCVIALALPSFAATDPTTPLGFEAPSQPTTRTKVRLPRLDAILCASENDCSAVLNGRALAKGQSINGYVIRAINEEAVTLVRGDRRWSLTVFNEQVVQ